MQTLQNPLSGRWRIEHFALCRPNRCREFFSAPQVNWEFDQRERIELPDGGVSFTGTLREIFGPDDIREAAYTCYPEWRMLCIERPDMAPDGSVKGFHTDRYRIERINPEEWLLYDLEGVEKEPEGYDFAVKIRKIEAVPNEESEKELSLSDHR